MEKISQQVKYQALRNGVIELLDMCTSLEDIASLGAFETINTIHDLLPLDYNKAPKVFSDNEKEGFSEFVQLVEKAADATENDTWDIDWFKASKEWVRLSEFAEKALVIFSERGRFSEDSEEAAAM